MILRELYMRKNGLLGGRNLDTTLVASTADQLKLRTFVSHLEVVTRLLRLDSGSTISSIFIVFQTWGQAGKSSLRLDCASLSEAVEASLESMTCEYSGCLRSFLKEAESTNWCLPAMTLTLGNI